MVSRVLVPMGGSEMAEHALAYALEVFPDAEITVLHVVGKPSPMMAEAASLALEDDVPEAAERRGKDVFDRARDIAKEYDAEVDTEVAIGTPAREIINRAEDFDTVVIGSHDGDLKSRLMIGNVAETVFRRSPVPVIVTR